VHWGDREVDVVNDCTGAEFSRASASAHLGKGVSRVLLSQPASVDVDSTIIWGLNHSLLAPEMSVISAGSCTSNALMPVLSVIDRAFGINAGVVTTIHSAMNDQPVIDAYHHTDLRKTRAAFNSVIPVETGLAQGVERFFPHLSDKISARALRVPTLNVSSLDVVLSVDKSTSAHEVNAAISESLDDFDGVLAVNSEPLASCDFLGAEASSIVDTTQTQVSNGHLIKLMIWFDNEWAFVNRMVDIVLRLSDFVAEESSS
jgi:glyceraldehyde-3-phosphate dehydrogenase type I